MTNRITKIDMLVYVPGVPERAYVPGGWFVIQRWPMEYMSTLEGMREIHDVIGDWDGGSTKGRLRDGYVEALQYTPPVDYRAAVPAYYRDDGVAEWNAGGTSVSPLDGDGAFQFKHSLSPGGVVTGFSTTALSHLPHEATHAFYIVGDVVKVMELGIVKHTFTGPADPDEYLTIQRIGTTVYYTHGAETHASAVPITTAKVYLDTALYLSGDYVDDPSLSEGVSGATEGDIDGELQAITGRAGIIISYIDASVRAVGGLVTAALRGATGRLAASLQPVAGDVTGVVGAFGGADATLKRVHGVVTDYIYSFVDGDMPAVRGDVTDIDESFFRTANSIIEFEDIPQGSMRIGETAHSGLKLSSSVKGSIFMSDALYDALILGDSISSHQSMADLISSAVALGTDLSQMLGVDLSAAEIAARAPTQYAVNIVTGAITTYDGFDFESFASVGQTGFGAKPDGLYRFRPTAPEDAGRTIAINFGAITLDAMASKTIEAVHVGVDTDGEVVVRLICGDIDMSYVATPLGDIRRAMSAMGVQGRVWDVSLEVTGATYFSLDRIGIMTASVGRHWPSE